MNDQQNFSTVQTGAGTAGLSALSICESMLIALNDLGIINDKQTHDVLADAAETHRSAANAADWGMHSAVADLIEKIMDGKNSVQKI